MTDKAMASEVMVYHSERVPIIIQSNNTEMKTAPENAERLLTSVPVGTTRIMLNATLGPSQKTLAAKFPEAACTNR